VPTYQISAPNGQTYRIDGPPGASDTQVQAEVLKQHPEAGTPKSSTPKAIGGGGRSALSYAKGLGQSALRAAGGAATSAVGVIDKPLVTTANIVGGAIDNALHIKEPDIEAPSDFWQQKIDRVAPPPTTTAGKGLEFVNQLAAGGALGEASKIAQTAGGLTSKIMPEARQLIDKGILTTPGIRRGGLAGSIEQHLAKLPLTGHNAAQARASAVQEWSRSELNDVVRSAGGKEIPAGLAGRKALRYVKGQLSTLYDSTLSKMKGDLGGGFRDSLDRVKQVAALSNLEQRLQKKLSDFIDKDIVGQFTASGRASGETLQKIGEKLRIEASKYARGGPEERSYADALKQIRADMDAMLAKENPELHEKLERINNAYTGFKSAARASLYAGKSGEFTPSQLVRAIKARDPSKDKIASALGTAPGLEKAEGAETALGRTVPDSGTPGTLELMQIAARLGHGAEGLAGAATLFPAAIANAVYSKPVLRFLQKRALQEATKRVARKIGAAAVAGGTVTKRKRDEDED
jgi:hypothetical protein